MDEVTGLTKNDSGEFVRGPARQNREDLIFRPRRSRSAGVGAKKHILVTDWDPRNPDVSAILKKHKSTLYRDPLNRRLFPDGSIIAGFRRRRNLGEMVGDSHGHLQVTGGLARVLLPETRSTNIWSQPTQ